MPLNRALYDIFHINIHNDCNSSHSLPKMGARERMIERSKDLPLIQTMATARRTTSALLIGKIVRVTFLLMILGKSKESHFQG